MTGVARMAVASTPPPPPEGHWLEVFDRRLLRRLVTPRTLELAVSSRLRYSSPPACDGGSNRVHAVLGEGSSDAAVRVQAWLPDGNATLAGECSRCLPAFGPCPHVAVLALDLAAAGELRDALLAGADTAELAGRAPEVRIALDAELRFDGAIAAWLPPTGDGERVEVAASPFDEVDPDVGRGYGERSERARMRVLSIVVRRAGERKLLSAREIAPQSHERIKLSPRDRRVLAYTRDRTSAKRAVYALGVEASLSIEAMRVHGGVFAGGYKGLLDFRPATVRPRVAFRPSGPAESRPPFEALAAAWVADGEPVEIAFADALFFPGPFPFIWAKGGAIYRVAPDVDLEMAAALERAEVLLVPRRRLGEAGARLLDAGRNRGIELPAAETFGIKALETPRIVLRLTGEPLDVSGELVAVYRTREVGLVPAAESGRTEGRDLAAERRARAHVEAAGLVPRAGGDHPLSGADVIAVRDEDAIAFWQRGLPGLRAACEPAVDVQLSERLAKVRFGAPLVSRVRVVLEGDWLKTKIEFGSSELPVELEQVRAALARKRRWVALTDGTLSRISASIEDFVDEAAGVMSGDEARLPAHQLGRLDRWVEENDGRIDLAVEGLRRRLRTLAVAEEPAMPAGLSATLRPYQRLGLAWLQFLQSLGAGGILADDMGLGKTITTLAFLLRRKECEGAAASLVVCPTSVATNWVREAARFTPDLRVILHHGVLRKRAVDSLARADVVVTTYAVLRRDIEALAAVRFRCAVLDEAQNIKNPDSATARAAGRLDAAMRLALSGTPIENRLRELWSLASFANPGILGSAHAFEARFERPIATDRASPLAAELRSVVRPFLLRRTKDDVLRELPPKTEIDRMITLRRADKRMYDALAHSLRASVAKDLKKRGRLPALSVFTALTRLRQMACDPRLIDGRLDSERRTGDGGARPGSAKRQAFLDLVRELVAEGRRALVFSQFVQLLTLWRRDLDEENVAYEYLDGKTSRRDEVVQRFQAGTAPLFLISLKAGGAGLNLTAADTVIHCDPWWNPAVEEQATDRAHRIGQDKPVTVVRLIARGTIEEKMLALKAKKRELVQAVIADDARALEGLTEEDVQALLGSSGPDEHREGEPGTPSDVLATAKRVIDPEFDVLAVEVQWWLASTGSFASELASITEIPLPFAARLAAGKPFPCSRAVADRIRARLRGW